MLYTVTKPPNPFAFSSHPNGITPMAKLCLNCGRSNRDRATTCKKCNASLGHALQMDAPSPSRRSLILIGIVGLLILVLNTFAVVRS
jgi:hypothetical protein